MNDLFSLAARLLRLLPPETAHRLTIRALATGLAPGPASGSASASRAPDDPVLRVRLWGRDFANPLGLAAGFDKNAEVPDAMLGLGFGFVEVGSVTPRPQPGNPKPRLFRLVEDRAVINRMGFNNEGHVAVRRRLARRAARRGIVGVNLGANKDSADRAGDYVEGVRALGPLADYLVVNVSSPNTPGLRALQGRAELDDLLARVLAARDEIAEGGQGERVPLLLKIAPDLAGEDVTDVVAVALARGLDGLIVSNTTVARPGSLKSRHADETGGLSGAPLFEPSTAMLARIRDLSGGRIPLVGVGGVASGVDAYAKIRAGATLVQLYTALIYEGPGLVGRIKRDLAAALKCDGFASVREAVGKG